MKGKFEEILCKLSQAFGPSGFEGEVRGIIRDELGSFCTVSHDLVGSVICRKVGASDSPKIMLAAHIDEVGFIVRSLRADGCASFVTLGSWRVSELPGTVVTLKSDSGPVRGVIGSVPVHFTRHKQPDASSRTLEDLFVDFGAKDREDAARFGVKVGTPFVPETSFARLEPGERFLGKAWDDRAGCAVMVESLKKLRDEAHPNTVFGVGTVQEEVGSKGAVVAANIVKPDISIVLECSPANDTVEGEGAADMRVGDGPQIRFYDPSMLPNRSLVELLVKTAEAHGIPHQVVVRGTGGTDGRQIQLEGPGVPCAVMSVVCRYAHSPAGLISEKDFENTVELLYWFLKEYDEERHREVTSF